MKRREFVKYAAAAPLLGAASLRAQQSALPIIGFLNSASEKEYVHLVAAFRKGLAEGGFVEGQNVTVEYRWANGQYEKLPGLASELVNRKVAVLVTHGPPAAKAAKAATSSLPIVFTTGDDPVRLGLVASMSRPGGNLTGITLVATQIVTKRVEIMREMLPRVSVMAALVNPSSTLAEIDLKELEAAARQVGVQMHVLEANTEQTMDKAFAAMAARKAGALIVGADPFYNSRRMHLIGLAARDAIPTIYPFREFTLAGGLMSYGTNLAFAYHASGVYAARVLKGVRPAELPVQQPTNFDLIVNAKTAKALGLNIPQSVFMRANEVIS